MSQFWKWTATQSARPSLLALLLAALLALGACSDMPEMEAPEMETLEVTASDADTEQPAADMDADDTDSVVESVEEQHVAEHMAAELTTETAADKESADEAATIPAVEDWTRHFVAEGPYVYLGNPEAPVTILDVSDFL